MPRSHSAPAVRQPSQQVYSSRTAIPGPSSLGTPFVNGYKIPSIMELKRQKSASKSYFSAGQERSLPMTNLRNRVPQIAELVNDGGDADSNGENSSINRIFSNESGPGQTQGVECDRQTLATCGRAFRTGNKETFLARVG